MNDDVPRIESVRSRGHDAGFRLGNCRDLRRARPGHPRTDSTGNQFAMLHRIGHSSSACKAHSVDAGCRPVSRSGNPIVDVACIAWKGALLEARHLRTIDHVPIHEPDQTWIVVDVKLLETASENFPSQQISLILHAIEFQVL